MGMTGFDCNKDRLNRVNYSITRKVINLNPFRANLELAA